MTRFYYFKITFPIVLIALGSGLTVYNILTLENFTWTAIGQAIFKSVFVAVFTALILALLNMFFKIIPIKKQ